MTTGDASQHERLPILFEKRLGHPTETELAAYCDVHDLIATVNASTGDVVVYRINGQVTFTIKGRCDDDVEVTVLKWKRDGSLLGVGWSDGLCSVYSGEIGKLLSQSSVVPEQGQDDWKLDLAPNCPGESQAEDGEGAAGRSVSCIGWTAYAFPSKQHNDISGLSELGLSPELSEVQRGDEFQNSNGDESSQPPTGIEKLVDSITTLDVTKVLPKLSAIPSHGARGGPEGSKFTSQAGVESVFETQRTESRNIDSLITSGNSGYTNVLLDESVKIGSFDLYHGSLRHTSHPQCSSQVVLSEASDDGNISLHYIDLPLDTLGSPSLHVIATNTKRLQSLMAYVSQTIRCIQHDFTTGLQVPTRFMNNITQELSEKEEGDLVTNFYHLAMTSNFTPTMLEWLTDIIKETNHKRWDQSITTMYSHIRDHLFMNLMPALDRLSIATSALRGQARLHENTTRFDVSPDLFTTLLDEVDAMRLVAHKILLIATAEYRQFRAFSKWLRVMIEVGIAGPGTKGAIETEEREVPGLDYGLLLAYIKDTLNRSKLAIHVEQRAGLKGSCGREEFLTHPIVSQVGRKNTITALEKLDKLEPGHELVLKGMNDPLALVNLAALAVRISGRVRLAIDSVTHWQSKMLLQPKSTPLDIEKEASILDLRMFPRDNDAGSITNLLTTSHPRQKRDRLYHYRVAQMQNSAQFDSKMSVIDITSGEVLYAQIIDQKRCIILFAHDDGRHMLLLCDLEEYAKEQSKWRTVLHVFEGNQSFVPVSFVIGGRRGKMVVVVFSQRGNVWKVLDLESHRRTNNDVSANDEMQL